MSNGPIYLAGKKNKFTFPGLSFDSAAARRFFDLEVVVVLVVLRMHKNHNEFVLADGERDDGTTTGKEVAEFDTIFYD